MTSREAYDAYTLYLGIKLHFYSKGYDFIKYNGKVKSDINSFLKRKDRYFFGKLFKMYSQDLQDFYIANLVTKDTWVGDLVNEECERVYVDWKKRNQKLSYLFQQEVNDLLQSTDINSLLKVSNGQHPILLKSYLSKKISLETLCIIDDIIGFSEDWKKNIEEPIVYPPIHVKMNKYKSFLTYDKKQYRKKLIELCST